MTSRTPLRTTPLLAVIAASALLAACGSSASDPSSTATGAASGSTSRGTIAWIAPTSGQAYYDAMTCAVKKAAEEAGFDTITQNAPDFDPVKYNQLVSAVAQRNPKALLADPIAGGDATPALKDAIETGIKVVTVETPTTIPGQSGNVVTDAVAFGRLTAKTLVESMGETGKVLLMDYKLGSPILDQRAQGIKEELGKYPGIEIVAHEYGGADAAKAAQLTLAVLARTPDLNGVVPTDTYDMAGVVNAMKQKNLIGKVTLIDIDATPTGIAHLKEKSIAALVVIKPAPYGREAVRVAIDAIDGRSNPDPLVLADAFLVVKPDNAAVLDSDPDLSLTGC
jgi:ribose transport system substrate-binding protein